MLMVTTEATHPSHKLDTLRSPKEVTNKEGTNREDTNKEDTKADTNNSKATITTTIPNWHHFRLRRAQGGRSRC